MERQAKLQDIASRDDLTQLQNRRVFYERLQEELETAERTRRQLSVIMIDVDDLKRSTTSSATRSATSSCGSSAAR